MCRWVVGRIELERLTGPLRLSLDGTLLSLSLSNVAMLYTRGGILLGGTSGYPICIQHNTNNLKV